MRNYLCPIYVIKESTDFVKNLDRGEIPTS